MVKNVTNPPIRQPIANVKTGGLVNIIWNNFFLTISQLFSPTSYGYQSISLSASGISGDYSISGTYLRDREFVNYSLLIVPGTSITLASCQVSGFPDLPLNIELNDVIELDSDSIVLSLDNGYINSSGILKIQDLTTSNRLLINGKYVRNA